MTHYFIEDLVSAACIFNSHRVIDALIYTETAVWCKKITLGHHDWNITADILVVRGNCFNKKGTPEEEQKSWTDEQPDKVMKVMEAFQKCDNMYIEK